MLKQKYPKDTTISWKERLSSGTIQEKSLVCPRNHTEWHVKSMKLSPGILFDIKINDKEVV